jgi:hypothetical protein
LRRLEFHYIPKYASWLTGGRPFSKKLRTAR